MRHHVVLFLAANPRGTTQPALDEECAAIQRELRMTPALDQFDLQARWAVSIGDVADHAYKLRPTIIHFSGGGSSSAGRQRLKAEGGYSLDATLDAGIYLQDDHTGQARYASASTLGYRLSSAAPWTRILVLNRCFNKNVAQLLSHYVVGMDGAASNDMSRSFAVAFYRALGNRCSIGNAVEQASAALTAMGLPDEHLPVCWTWGERANQIFLQDPDRPGW